MNSKAYLTLADGHVFEGVRVGADGDALGELVFTTGMCGYIETLTDPSYYGQIVVQTFPMIGNYGFIPADRESDKSVVKGYIAREIAEHPSNFRCELSLGEYLASENIVALTGLDTREITKTIRGAGVMNAIISDAPCVGDPRLAEYRVCGSVEAVSCREVELFPAAEPLRSVALIDYGAKRNIIRELNRRGCSVTSFPALTGADEILNGGFDGVMLSNGPGDPADNGVCIETIRGLLGRLPIFGICLGHQLLALAAGGKTEKLKYGHRGTNQPVKDLATGRMYVTSQNHGYAVVASSLAAAGGVESFVNQNDFTCEGADYPALNAFSVQFHPEAASGTHDTVTLFDRFVSMLTKGGRS